jgi:hypothetical protein
LNDAGLRRPSRFISGSPFGKFTNILPEYDNKVVTLRIEKKDES